MTDIALLRTPVQRIGLVVLIVGVAVAILGWVNLGPWSTPADCFEHWSRYPNWCGPVRYGALVGILSIVFLLGFNLTMRPLLRWIHGPPA